VAITGELWNELAIGIGSRFCAREAWAGFQRACPLARSGARNTRKVWMRETTTKGWFASMKNAKKHRNTLRKKGWLTESCYYS
jgi:hypothetical protein